MNTKLLKRWRAFLAADPTTHDGEAIADALADAISAEWNADPVAAFAPDVCAEYRVISKGLATIYRDKDKTWYDEAWGDTSALFKAGCAFGDAMQKLWEALEDPQEEAEREAMEGCRVAFMVIAGLADKNLGKLLDSQT